MINAEQLTAIKERAAKATPGNWRVTLDDPYDRTYVLGAFNNAVSVIADIQGDADAIFIASSREDVPALVAEVERLRAELQDIIAVATEEASSLSYESGYEDIVKIASDALK